MRTTTTVPPRRPFAILAAALAAALVIASLGLAACGGSSGSSSNGASGSSTATGNAAVHNAVRNGAVRNEAAAKALRAFRQRARAAKGSAAARRRFAGPGAVRFRQALTKFAACLRQNGVNVPAPDPSGHGPVFSTKGVNTASPQFRAATTKCRTALMGALRGR